MADNIRLPASPHTLPSKYYYESPLGARSYMWQKSNAKRAGISRDGT